MGDNLKRNIRQLVELSMDIMWDYKGYDPPYDLPLGALQSDKSEKGKQMVLDFNRLSSELSQQDCYIIAAIGCSAEALYQVLLATRSL